MEDLQRQQQLDRERIRTLEKQLNAMEIRHRQDVEGLRRQAVLTQGCCDSSRSLQNRMTDIERKIDTTSEDVQVLQDFLKKNFSGVGHGGGQKLDGEGGSSQRGGNQEGSNGGYGHEIGGLEGLSCEKSCSHLELRLKEYINREVEDLRSVFLDRFDDQDDRITATELDLSLVKTQAGQHPQTLENITLLMSQRLEECGCGGGSPPIGGKGAGRPGGGGGQGGSRWSGGGTGGGAGGEGGTGGETVGGGGREGGGEETGESGGVTGVGGRGGAAGEKSLAWRVVANENQIRHFNTRLRDLSVSGDSLQDQVRPANLLSTHTPALSIITDAPYRRQVLDLSLDVRQIKALTGDNGEHFNRIVTEVEQLGNGCELCGKVQDELLRLKNLSQATLGRLEGAVTDLQAKLNPGDGGCVRSCSQIEQEVRLLREDVRSCTSRCQSKGQLSLSSVTSSHVTYCYGHLS